MELKLEAHKRDWGMRQKDQALSLDLLAHSTGTRIPVRE